MKIASWIPTEERLPEHPCFCAVLTSGDRTSTTWAFFALGVFLIYLPDPENELMMIGMPFHGAVTHWFDPATLPIDPLSAILHEECDRRESALGINPLPGDAEINRFF